MARVHGVKAEGTRSPVQPRGGYRPDHLTVGTNDLVCGYSSLSLTAGARTAPQLYPEREEICRK
jgi:hypothetical protein